MKANCWNGVTDFAIEDVPDPRILIRGMPILRIASTAICGSDLHLYDGYIPTMMKGDILGHEFMGEVVEVGPGVTNLKVGDRVVNPFPIACGGCFFCASGLHSLCENSNPNAWQVDTGPGERTRAVTTRRMYRAKGQPQSRTHERDDAESGARRFIESEADPDAR